jgi:hypothetical protein
MKRKLVLLTFILSASYVWGQTVTRTLPSSFVPPPPPPNQAEIQTVGSLQFFAFQNNMFAPLFNKKQAEEKEKQLAASKATDPLNQTNKSHGPLLPKSYESSIHGLQFVEPSPLHSQ